METNKEAKQFYSRMAKVHNSGYSEPPLIQLRQILRNAVKQIDGMQQATKRSRTARAVIADLLQHEIPSN